MSNGVIPPFIELCGLPVTDLTIPANTRDINPGLSRDEIEFLLMVKSTDLADVEKMAVSKILIDSVRLLGAGTNFTYQGFLSSPERVALLERYQESNSRVAREYLGREEGVLFYEDPPDRTELWEPYPGLRAETVAEILARMKEVIKNTGNTLFDVDCQNLHLKVAAAVHRDNVIKSGETDV